MLQYLFVSDFLMFLEKCGLSDRFTFFYMPCKEHRNVPAGFAFANFISPIDVHKLVVMVKSGFWREFMKEPTVKAPAVSYARFQGHEELVKHFSSSAVLHEQDPEKRPIFRPEAAAKAAKEKKLASSKKDDSSMKPRSNTANAARAIDNQNGQSSRRPGKLQEVGRNITSLNSARDAIQKERSHGRAHDRGQPHPSQSETPVSRASSVSRPELPVQTRTNGESDLLELAKGGEALMRRLADVNSVNGELRRKLEKQSHEISLLEESGRAQQQLFRDLEYRAPMPPASEAASRAAPARSQAAPVSTPAETGGVGVPVPDDDVDTPQDRRARNNARRRERKDDARRERTGTTATATNREPGPEATPAAPRRRLQIPYRRLRGKAKPAAPSKPPEKVLCQDARSATRER
eukprot:s2398_g6.t1